MKRGFPPDMLDRLGTYVYVYIDPRDGRPFYIGKGIGNRAFYHLNDETECKKVEKIAEIRAAGFEPRIDLLRYGLTQERAAVVEASCIDLIGFQHLANQQRGYHESSFSRINVKELLMTLSAAPATIRNKALLIIINKLYRSDMTDLELYEATRGIWKLRHHREQAEIAMAVYQGIVREVYRIHRWHPAGTLPYETRDSTKFAGSGRWEFEGAVATDLRKLYVGKSVRNYLGSKAQFPVRYTWKR